MVLLPPHLTHREAEILACLLRGLTNKEIAAALGMSAAAVKHHLGKMEKKLKVDSRGGLVQAWIDWIYQVRLEQVSHLVSQLDDVRADLVRMEASMREGWLSVRLANDGGDEADNPGEGNGVAAEGEPDGFNVDRYSQDARGRDGEGGGSRPPNRPPDH